MPLIILGLFVIVGIVLYALVRYESSVEEDTRPVRERYPHAFNTKKEVKDIFDSFVNIDEDENADEDTSNDNKDSEDNTLKFPDNAELEKRKRNIH